MNFMYNSIVKRSVLAAGISLLSLGATAQSKIDLGSQARLRAAQTPMEVLRTSDKQATVRPRTAQATSEPMVQGFITLAPGADATALEQAGVTVNRVRGNMVLAEFPRDILDAVEALPEVSKITVAKTLIQKMDRAREVSGIDKIHSGLDLPQAYTGKGIVAGIVDGGFDPNHVNFKNDDGTSRISSFTYYRPVQSGGYVEQKFGADYIPVIDTENDETYHGTHTLGIMAGSYRGDVTAGVALNEYEGEAVTKANPYYGVAYDADIALACGALNDYYIAMGVETILDYAYYKEAPAVVNLSLGSNVGPHDGTSTICQYLDQVSDSDIDHVIFCVSAGNEGDLPIALNKTFTADDKVLQSCFLPATKMDDYQNVRYGQTYVYSASPTQFEIQIIVINMSRGKVALRLPLPATEGASKYWITSEDYRYADDDVLSAQLAKWFDGYIGVGAEFDEFSGRYYAVLDYMCWDNTSGVNADGNYVLGFQVTGSEGQRVDAFCDGVFNYLDDYGLEGFSKGTPDGSISDVACGHNYVTVGSYNTRDDWASVDGGIYGYMGGFPVGKISSYSSYGRLYDGRELPTVCAPGASIISSSNQYFLDKVKAGDGAIQAKLEADGRVYSWHQSTGTSMASPVVAGSIALWLEADPALTYSDVIDIIRKTAVRDDDVATSGNPLQWGAGKFDAYAGLKEVLERKAGIGSIDAGSDGARPVIAASSDRNFRVYMPGADHGFAISLYNVAGLQAMHLTASSAEMSVDTSTLPAGVYILKVDGTPYSERILVK